MLIIKLAHSSPKSKQCPLSRDMQVVAAGETDNAKLIDMILETKQQVKEQGISEIVQLFHLTAEYSRHCKQSNTGYGTIAEDVEGSQ